MMKLRSPFQWALTIKAKFALITGLSVALAAVLVELILFRGSVHTLVGQAELHLITEANIASTTLIEEVDNLSNDTIFLSRLSSVLPVLEQSASADLEYGRGAGYEKVQLIDLMLQFARAKPNYFKVRLIGVKNGGKEIITVEHHQQGVYLIPEHQLQNKRHRPYYRKSLLMPPGEVYLSDITLNREYGEVHQPFIPVMHATSPVYIDGELYGMIVISMAFKPVFNKIIASAREQASLYLTNDRGDILVNPDGSLDFAFEFNQVSNIAERVPQSLWTDGTTEAGELHHFAKNEETWLMQMARAQFDPRNQERFLGVFLLTSEQALLKESISLLNQKLTYVIIMVLLTIVIVAIWSRRILKPLKEVIKAADGLAHGDKTVTLCVNRRDEIGDMARAFDAMRGQLRKKEFAALQNETKAVLAAKKAAIGDIACGMAHEINSPIQAIKLSAERLTRKMKKSGLEEKDVVSLDKIVTSVGRVSGIIKSLSKISRNNHNEAFQRCLVTDFICDAADLVEEKYQVNGIDFSIDYHDNTDTISIECQRLHLAQVIVNLLNNACDVVSELDEKWIRIQVHQSDSQVIVRVMDSGSGIPADIRERIFEPMFTTKDIGRGTGLGLSISRTIVRGHGGELSVDTRYPNTCFILTLNKEHNHD